MQDRLLRRLQALAAREPGRAQRVHLVELRELAVLLGPQSGAAALLSAAETLINPVLYRLAASRQWLVLIDAAPDDTVVIRRWW